MYVTFSKGSGYVFVGDRANNRVVVFDKDDFSVEATIPAGIGCDSGKPGFFPPA
jgi:DNA-binding beta-propeller fold protein YncE